MQCSRQLRWDYLEDPRVSDAVKKQTLPLVEVTIDDEAVRVPEGSTLLDACRVQGIATPTLCYLDTLRPVNVCRVCVVELEGSRTLVPSCSRKVPPGAVVHTNGPRVRDSR